MNIKKISTTLVAIILIIIAVFMFLVSLIPVRVVDPKNPRADKNGWVEMPLWKSVIFKKNMVLEYDSIVFPLSK